MVEDCQYVSTCFLIERERLRDWVVSIGLDKYVDEQSVNPSIRNSRLPLLAILTEIRVSIIKFLLLNGQYDELKVSNINGQSTIDPGGHGLITIDGKDLTEALDLAELPFKAEADSHKSFLQKLKRVSKPSLCLFPRMWLLESPANA
jgi:hypothetical protein